MRPAGGDTQMDLSLVHLAASDGVERLFSHPLERDDPRKRQALVEHQRYAALLHGLRNTKAQSIRVNQPNNFGATFLNVIGGSTQKHRDWMVENYYGQQALANMQH
jgi:hypothetical protein